MTAAIDSLPREIVDMIAATGNELPRYMMSRCCAGWYWYGHTCACGGQCNESARICPCPIMITADHAAKIAAKNTIHEWVVRLLPRIDERIIMTIFVITLRRSNISILDAIHAFVPAVTDHVRSKSHRTHSAYYHMYVKPCVWTYGAATAVWLLDHQFNAVQAMHCALQHNNVDVIRVLTERKKWRGYIEPSATRHVECLTYLHSIGGTLSPDLYETALAFYNFNSAKYLADMGCKPSYNIFKHMLLNGSIEMNKYIIDHCAISSEMTDSIEQLTVMHRCGIKIDADMFREAIREGKNKEIITYMIIHFAGSDDDLDDILINISGRITAAEIDTARALQHH